MSVLGCTGNASVYCSFCAADTKRVKSEVVPRNDTEQGIFSGTGKHLHSGAQGLGPKSSSIRVVWRPVLRNLEYWVKQNGGSLRLGKDPFPDHQPNQPDQSGRIASHRREAPREAGCTASREATFRAPVNSMSQLSSAARWVASNASNAMPIPSPCWE